MRAALRRWWRRLWHGGLHVRPEPLLTIETIEGRRPKRKPRRLR